MSDPHIFRGMSSREALEAARELGCEIETGHRHGEVRFAHPLHNKRIVTHSARKDAAAELVYWLLDVVEAIAAVRTLRRLRPELLCEPVQILRPGARS